MYKLIIPSYKREEQLQEKTLKVLERYNIPPDKVYIFVANEEEKERYEKALANNKYNNIQLAVPTIGAARNYIEQEFFDEGEYIVSLDDDLTGIYRWENEKTLVEVDDFEKELIIGGYEAMQREGSKCWGIYAAANPFFMSDSYTTKLCYIIASCYGFIVEHNDFLKRETNHGDLHVFVKDSREVVVLDGGEHRAVMFD